jgi:FixJ family two-component response regulator
MNPTDDATVFVIDDDGGMRAAMQRLLKSVGLYAEAFASPQEFLQRKLSDGPSCLVLDVRLPGMSGLDVQRRLIEVGVQIPIIFITGFSDEAISRPGFVGCDSAGAAARTENERAAAGGSGIT